MIIVGVRFRNDGRIYYFGSGSINESELKQGVPVIVETARGVEYGVIAVERRDIDVDNLNQPINLILRVATDQDEKQEEENQKSEADAKIICQEKISAHNLDMRLVDVSLTFDLSKIIFFFTADGRIDFRELVKDLASTFRMRIELRQIGVRDEAKMLNGVGICGRTLCCATFLDDFQPVSIKLAKDQGLSLNPTKISGVCGKLMCCLKYEEETYDELNKGMPGVGDTVRTPDGDGLVLSINILRQTVKVAVQVKGQDDTKAEVYDATNISILTRNTQCDRGCGCGKCRTHKKNNATTDQN